MMRKLVLFLMLMTMLAIGLVPTSAQSNTPDIVLFTTPFTSIGLNALSNRTARIPVSWSTVNRPLSANLIFEQVLPDGSTINVELPRLIPFVASSGDGIAAPILPGTSVTSIRLRVTLKGFFNNVVYDTAEFTLPIVNGNGGSGSGNAPSITVFEAPADVTVNRAQLAAGNVQIPVRWTAINRPITANLEFEQVLNDGSIINVEQPRDFIWVNSSDRGVVVPVSPGGDANSITLRVRLVDLVFNRTYDVRYFYVPIRSDEAPPQPIFLLFSAVNSQIDRSVVASGNARIDVIWSLANRPPNTNLIFEQVMPNGTVRNAELPRDFVIVPSSGNGIVTALLPDSDVTKLNYRLRLVDIRNQATLLTTEMSINLIGGGNNGGNNTVRFINLSVSPTTILEENLDTAEVSVVWETNNATSVRIEAANLVVNIPNAVDGSYGITLADVDFEGDTLDIQVTARDAQGNTTSRSFIVIIDDSPVECHYEWTLAVDTDECPFAGTVADGAYQLFDRGFMVWSPLNNNETMLVFYNDGTVIQYTDNWDSQDYEIEGTPPEGKYAPERGFGYLWSSQPLVRSGLGWAAAPEIPLLVLRQPLLADSGTIFMSLPEGRVVRYGGGQWEFVN